MSLMVTLIDVGISSADVTLPSLGSFTNAGISAPTYSGVRFGSDGYIYRASATGSWQNVAAWLIKGTASNYYIQRVVDDGSLDTDGGDGQQLNANRDYYVTDSTPGALAKTAVVTYEISSDAPGTTVLAGPKTYSFRANYEPLL